jgi:DNA-binding transcriptional LysR family regulator
MSLTLRQLEVFLAAADDCNFRRAAQRLGISQPSVSGRIRSLEMYLGYDLFHRSGGSGAKLTPEGRAFVTKARHLVQGASELSAQRGSSQVPSQLRLTVAIGPLLLKHCVMPELPNFCYEHSEIAVDFVLLGTTSEGNEMLRRGQADVLVFNGDLTGDREYETQILRRAPCSIFGAPQLISTIAPTGQISNDALSKVPFILPPEHHTWTAWARDRLADAGVFPSNTVIRPQFPELRIQMAVEGRGLSVFFDEFVANTPLQPVGPALAPASLVMVLGPRAKQEAGAPLLSFIQRVTEAQGL